MRQLRAVIFTATVGLSGLFAVVPGCTKVADPWPEKPGPKVLASFAPLYCFALNVAGDDASVLCVMAETGPHEFDPSPRDAAAINRADLFLINGLGLDDEIAQKMTRSANRSSLKVVAVGQAIPEKELIEGVCEHDHAGHEDADHVHFDPHVWMGVPEAIEIVNKIRDELKAIDPAHAEGYDRRAAAYVDKLNKLRDEGLTMIKSKKNRNILSFHDSLRYFARSFELEIVDSIESAPGNEPDARTLSELVTKCQEKKVRVIAVEPQYDSNTSARTILRELTAKGMDVSFVIIDPMETALGADRNAELYEKKMRENLRQLADKLQ